MRSTTTPTRAPSIDSVAYAQRTVRKLVTSNTCDRSRGLRATTPCADNWATASGGGILQPDLGARRDEGAKGHLVDDDEDSTVPETRETIAQSPRAPPPCGRLMRLSRWVSGNVPPTTIAGSG